MTTSENIFLPSHESTSILDTIRQNLELLMTENRTRRNYNPDEHQDNVLDVAYDVVVSIMDTHPHITSMPELTEILDSMKMEGTVDDEVYDLIVTQI